MLSVFQKFRHRIFAKVLLFLCASVFTILFSSFYIFEKIEFEEKKNALLKRQKMITQSQSIIIPQYIVNNDEEAITLALSGVLSNPIIVGVAIYQPDGNTLYRFGNFQSATNQLHDSSHPITFFDGSKVRQLGTLVTVSTERLIVENMQPCLSGYHPHPLYVVCTHFPE